MRMFEGLSINNERFEGVRAEFDTLFQNLFRKMAKTKADEGTITLKIKVNLCTDEEPKGDGTVDYVKNVVFVHAINTAVPIKDKLDGVDATGMKIAYDEYSNSYGLKPINRNGQMSFEDLEEQRNVPDKNVGKMED